MFHSGSIKIYSIIELMDFTVKIKKSKIEIFINRIHIKDYDYPKLIGLPTKWSQCKASEIKLPEKIVDLEATIAPETKVPSDTPKSEYTSIKQLSNYMTNFKLCARVIYKNLKSTTNKEGKPIKVLTITLADDSGEIRCAAFNDAALKINDMVEVDNVYRIKGGSFKYANQDYSSVGHKFEITFFKSSKFELVTNQETVNIGKPSYSFIPIKDIVSKSNKSIIDVVGYVSNCGEITNVNLKNGATTIKRTLSIIDKSRTEIEITLWANHTGLVTHNGQVIAVKGAQVGEYFNRKQLSVLRSTLLSVDNLTIPEVLELKELYSSEEEINDTDKIPKSYISVFDNLKRICDLDFSQIDREKSESCTLIVWLCEIFHKRKVTYFACPNEECKNKAMTQENDFSYYCNKCEKRYPQPKYRYTLVFKIADYTGSAIMHALGDDDSTTTIMGINAETYYERSLDLDPDVVEKIFFVPQRYKLLKIRANVQKHIFHDQIKDRIMTTHCELLDYGRAAQFLADEIDKYD